MDERAEAEPTPREARPARPARRPMRPMRRLRKRWRKWLRALHRDAGYLAIGLTVIYALSGIAINHIQDWNPNFKTVSATHQLELPVPAEEEAAIQYTLDQLGIDGTPRDAYLVTDTQLEIYLDNRSLIVETDTGTVYEEGSEPRFFLRVANWLHYNRGKKAWTYIADGYAAFLLFLAVSGIFMLKGRQGIWGRGAILIALGAGVPIAYITLAGGPGG
jgi:hypothetical protein